MSFCPVGWDAKSWDDVVSMEQLMRVELDRLRSLIGQEDADASKLADTFSNIERLASVGAVAASWCKP